MATRNALLDAAELVFETRGVAGTSLQHIAAQAGLTRGAVYWHFKDKADLFNAMMARATLPYEDRWSDSDTSDSEDPLVKLRSVLLAWLEETALQPRLQRVFTIAAQMVEYVDELNAIRDRHLMLRSATHQRIRTLLERAKSLNQLPPDIDPQHAAMGLHALVSGLLYNWTLDPKAFDVVAVSRLAVDRFIAGLCQRPGPGLDGDAQARH